MKKRFISLALCLVLLISVLPMSALAAQTYLDPKISEDGILSWNALEGAVSYTVNAIGPDEFVLVDYDVGNACSFDIDQNFEDHHKPTGTYEVWIFGWDSDGDTVDNCYVRNDVTYYYVSSMKRLASPTGLAWASSGVVATWDPVPNATSYQVALKRGAGVHEGSGIVSCETSECQYDLSSYVSAGRNYYFVVTAEADDYLDSYPSVDSEDLAIPQTTNQDGKLCITELWVDTQALVVGETLPAVTLRAEDSVKATLNPFYYGTGYDWYRYGEQCSVGDTIISGKDYRLYIYATANDGYYFSKDVVVYGNGGVFERAEVSADGTEIETSQICYTPVDIAEKECITELWIDTQPLVVGEPLPAVTLRAADSEKATLTSQSGIGYHWYRNAQGCSVGDIVESGGDYSLYVYALAKSGYYFSDNVVVNGNGGVFYNAETFDDKTFLDAELFYTPQEVGSEQCITELWIDTQPLVVGKPLPAVTLRAADGEKATLTSKSGIGYNWYRNTQECSVGDIVESGGKYALYVYALAKSGYYFSDNVVVNGNGGVFYNAETSEDKTFLYSELFYTPQEAGSGQCITELWVEPQTSLEVGGTLPAAVLPEAYEAVATLDGYQWYINSVDIPISVGATVEDGAQYLLFATVSAKPGYSFADNVVVKNSSGVSSLATVSADGSKIESVVIPFTPGQAQTLQPTLTGSMPFHDVAMDAWYYDNVSLAYSHGLMNGMTATTFDPEGSVTLAQAVTLAVRAHHLYYGLDAVQIGSGDDWYLPYVQAAVQYGIMTGKEFTDYSRPATRAELAYLFAHVLPQSAYTALNQVETISDVPQSMQYAAEILQMYRAGVLTGYEDSSFRPNNTVRRCEVAAIITRVILPTQRIAAK